MEKRTANIIISKAGGNASQNSIKYKINLPTKWINDMKITQNEREIELEYDEDEKIIIIRKERKNMYLVNELKDKYEIRKLCVQNEEEYYEGNHDCTGEHFFIDKDEVESYESLEKAIQEWTGNSIIGIIYE